MSGKKIIDGLKDVVAGNAKLRVIPVGETWGNFLTGEVSAKHYVDGETIVPPMDWRMLRRTMTATFQPKRTDNLRPELEPLIGQTAEWECGDYGGADEPYPGQYRWFTKDARWEGHWVPDEDLDPRVSDGSP